MENSIERKNQKKDKDELVVLQKVLTCLNDGKWVKDGEWASSDIEVLNAHNFLTAKPVVFLVNISEDEFRAKKNKHLAKIMEWVGNNGGGPVIPFSASYEQQLVDLGAIDGESR